MNLKTISDSILLSETKFFASEEKRNAMEVLRRLREIEARKLFAPLGFSSLFNYCIAELELSEGAACRRIQSVKILSDVPEFVPKLELGLVTESSLGKVQSFFNQQKKKRVYSKKEKLELLEQIEGKSARQTDRLLATLCPEMAKPEVSKPMNSEQTEIRFTADRELLAKLEKLQDLLGHKLGNRKYSSLIEELADIVLKKMDRSQKTLPPVLTVRKETATRYIPENVKTAVWQRDQGRCTLVNAEGKRCESKHALQYEHKTPFAKGGKSTAENLTLLCLGHNQWSAIEAYGLEKMRAFWAK